MAFKHYLEEENDKPYFTTNSLGYYYDKMEGFAEKVEQASKTLNITKEEVEKRLTLYIEQNKNELDQRLAQWDVKLETLDSSVETLLTEWVDDGTLTPLIDSTLIDQKIAPVTAQLEKTVKRASIPNQVDYVKDLQKLGSHSRKMNVQIVQESSKVTNVNIPLSGDKAVTYEFFKNSNDDYMIMLDGSVGNQVPQLAISNSFNAEMEGTFVLDFPPNVYTVVVGSKLRFPPFVGTQFNFNTLKDNRGGLWKFTLDGGTSGEKVVNVSVFNSTSLPILIKVFENMEFKSHTVVAEFMGQDPANPVDSPRGYFKLSGLRPQDIVSTADIFNNVFSVAKTHQILYSYSNKEFAFEARPAGSTGVFHFIPEHNGVGTAFKVQETKLLADGKPVVFRTGTYTFDVETIQLIQKVHGIYPGDPTNPLMEITTYHTIKDGVVTISGKVKILRDTEISKGYAFMFPYFANFASKIKTSLQNEYGVITNQANYKEYWSESDGALSYVVVNDNDATKSKVAAAMTIDNFARTMRQGESGRGDPFSWIEHRSANLGKLYFQQFKDVTLSAGYEYRFDGRFIVTEIDDISSFVL